MDEQVAAGRRLAELARSYIDRDDKAGLARRLEADWSSDCLALLLGDDDAGVVELAALGLGLIGDMSCCPRLAQSLHHEDQAVVLATEDALWSIWFRAGGCMGQAALTRIAEAIKAGTTENVVPMLTELIRTLPTYAEAHHQRSQAYYLEGVYALVLRDARRAFELNPWHFGALANQAHALSALGRMQEALRVYRQVLELHPRMPGVRESIRRLRERLALVEA
jgi:tetratricopeptide (TPR) repeat protein